MLGAAPPRLEGGTYHHDGDKIRVGCYRCGETYELGNDCAIAGDGRITPAVECQICFWSEWITLESWSER